MAQARARRRRAAADKASERLVNEDFASKHWGHATELSSRSQHPGWEQGNICALLAGTAWKVLGQAQGPSDVRRSYNASLTRCSRRRALRGLQHRVVSSAAVARRSCRS